MVARRKVCTSEGGTIVSSTYDYVELCDFISARSVPRSTTITIDLASSKSRADSEKSSRKDKSLVDTTQELVGSS
jgi:hypothetical protein